MKVFHVYICVCMCLCVHRYMYITTARTLAFYVHIPYTYMFIYIHTCMHMAYICMPSVYIHTYTHRVKQSSNVLWKTATSPITIYPIFHEITFNLLTKPLVNYWKDWCWSWSSNNLASWCKEPTHWKKSWFWERLKAAEGGDRGWDG